MRIVQTAVKRFQAHSRSKRASLFGGQFEIGPTTRILDLGSEDGTNINMVLRGTAARPENVYIADIDPAVVERGRKQYGYVPVAINESGQLPFPDGYFDIVYCSSVIEHVTVDKSEVWSLRDGRTFRSRALLRQGEFAKELRRLGKHYFVQTPNLYFPIESHSWLPFIHWLPRALEVPIIELTNRFWLKQTAPDYRLLGRREMLELFPDARLISERTLGLTKSIMAVR